MANFLNCIPLAIRRQAKAFLGGLVAAVVAAETPLVQGGSWSLNTLYAAAASAVVAYAGVYLTSNAPAEMTVLEQLLASMVGQIVPGTTGRHAPADPAASNESVSSFVSPAPVTVVPVSGPAPALDSVTPAFTMSSAPASVVASPAPAVVAATQSPA